MPRGPADHQEIGTWNVRCSMCYAKRKASEMVKNWQGQYRCPTHNEPRHPQDFLKAIPDNPSVPYVQDPGQSFITLCDVFGVTSVADYAVADCSVCDVPLSIAGY